MISILLTAAVAVSTIGGCPKPAPHAHHVPKAAPMCTCSTLDPPRVILMPAPEADPEPIELHVVTYYVTAAALPDPAPVAWDWEPEPYMVWGVGGRQIPSIPSHVAAPELDAGSLAGSITLLGFALCVIRDKRRTT